jgi:hypothetical protein
MAVGALAVLAIAAGCDSDPSSTPIATASSNETSVEPQTTAAPIGSATSSEPQTTTTAPSSETSSEPQTTGMVDLLALVVARLSYSASSNCYYIADPDSGIGESVIWPENTTPATDGSGIHAGARWIPVGSIVSGGGGAFPSQPMPHFDDRPACLIGSSEVFIFNAGTHLDVGTGLGP